MGNVPSFAGGGGAVCACIGTYCKFPLFGNDVGKILIPVNQKYFTFQQLFEVTACSFSDAI